MDDLVRIALSNAVAATVLALVALLVGSVTRQPALRHGLWLLVLLKLVTPPLVPIPINWPTPSDPMTAENHTTPVDSAPATVPPVGEQPAVVVIVPQAEDELPADEVPDVAAAQAEPAVVKKATPFPWPQVLQMVWAIGSLGWFLLALERLHRFRRLLRFAQPAPAAVQERARRLARSLGIEHCPRVRLLPGRIAPMLWAIGGPPRLFVPADLLGLLTTEQLDTLLLHELAHLRRRDHWVRVLEFVVMGLYWWHPAVWYARRELREAEEQCCDAWVVSTLPGAGRTYASALVDTLDFLSLAQPAVPPLASGLGQIADLKRRLTMIMGGTTPRSLSWPGCLAVVCLAAFLPMLPAQPPTDVEIEIQKDDGKQQIEKERAELEKLEADLKKKLAELEAAKGKLKAAAEARIREKVVPNVKGWVAGQKIRVIADGDNIKIITDDEGGKAQNAAKGKKSVIHIAIVVDDDINAKDLLKKLNSVLPKGSKIQMDEQIHIQSQMLHKESKVVVPKIHEVVVPQIQFHKLPANMLAPSDKPMKAPAGVPAGPGKGQDQRINELEKRLEKVLQELQEMRKQMKQSRTGAARAPAGPLPPVQPPPLENVPAAPPADGDAVPPPPAGANPPPPPVPERN